MTSHDTPLSPMRSLEHASVEELAKKRNVSMAQVALAWTLTKEGSLNFPTLPFVCQWAKGPMRLTQFFVNSRLCSHHRHYIP